MRRQTRGGDTVLTAQSLDHGLCTPLGQSQVVIEAALVIGVPDDQQLQSGLSFKQLGRSRTKRVSACPRQAVEGGLISISGHFPNTPE